MKETELKKFLAEGNAFLGIELGSTRIKSILIGADCKPLASGSYDWESRYENGIWTYPLADVWAGIQSSYEKLLDSVQKQYGVQVTSFRAIGISAMMHGYLPFNARGEQLVPFRTWCNTMTEDAAAALSELFQFNIPQRWSIAHLYHAILQGESHINEVAFLTTLSGYIHWQLTGKKVLGVGDASGMFPIDSSRCDFNARMIEQFDQKMAEENIPWNLKAILPHVLSAGEPAGTLTAAGAKLLDPSGALQAGIPLCPPEGDAGTGMVATNSVAERTGNVSAGTSIFAMVVLEKMLQSVYTEVDLVTTPSGRPVAMVHCNNCTSDLNAWAGVLQGFADALGVKCSIPQVLDTLFFSALQGEPDCGGLLSYNYSSGEPITRLDAGRPLFVRRPDSNLTFANFARSQLFSAVATLKLGMDLLLQHEKIHLNSLMGHGGFFKAEGVGQRVMAAALNVPVSVMETAGEGGPWGIALLASYMAEKKDGQTLEDYLDRCVFAGSKGKQVLPAPRDVEGFAAYMKQYEAGLAIEQAAVASL